MVNQKLKNTDQQYADLSLLLGGSVKAFREIGSFYTTYYASFQVNITLDRSHLVQST